MLIAQLFYWKKLWNRFCNFMKKKKMKNLILILCLLVGIYSCKTSKSNIKSNPEINTKLSDTVRIANDEVEYEIIIIEPGFNAWLESRARPRGYYGQQFLENRNRLYVTSWNNRVLDSRRYNPNLYQMQIDYNHSINYGYEVNYLLYNYFIYFQLQYKQKLTGFTPRI